MAVSTSAAADFNKMIYRPPAARVCSEVFRSIYYFCLLFNLSNRLKEQAEAELSPICFLVDQMGGKIQVIY